MLPLIDRAGQDWVEQMTEEGVDEALSQMRKDMATPGNFSAFLLRKASAATRRAYLTGVRAALRAKQCPVRWQTLKISLAEKAKKDKRLLKARRDIMPVTQGMALAMRVMRPALFKEIEEAKADAQSGFTRKATITRQTLSVKAAVEAAMVEGEQVIVSWWDYAGYFMSIPRDVQQEAEKRYGMSVEMSDCVRALHDALRGYFDTQYGSTSTMAMRNGTIQGSPLAPGLSTTPLTLVDSAVRLLAPGNEHSARGGDSMRGGMHWVADDDSWVCTGPDAREMAQLTWDTMWMRHRV